MMRTAVVALTAGMAVGVGGSFMVVAIALQRFLHGLNTLESVLAPDEAKPQLRVVEGGAS